MGSHHLPAAGLILATALAATAPAQGPLKRERWAYAHLERLRAQVARELLGRESEQRRRVVQAVAADDRGIPFLPWVRALAELRGVEADAAFTYRAMLCAFPLPEVVDPQGDNPECQNFNLSLFLPYTIEQPGDVAFSVTVADQTGEVLWRGELLTKTAMEDLRTARPVAVVAGRDLPDGSYRVSVRTAIDGEDSRRADQVLVHDFHVLRGYQARAERAMQQVQARADRLSPWDRAMLVGLTLGVSGPYSGEPFEHVSSAVRDLERVEKALSNLEAGRPLLQGITGRATVGLPVQELGQFLLVTLDLPQGETEAKPLIVFVSGSPSYDGSGHRPDSPDSRHPAWLAAQVLDRGFNDDGAFRVAVLESSGRLRDSIAALADGLDALTDWLQVPEGRVLLVAEREGAVLATLGMQRLEDRIAGLVLVAGGALARPTLEAAGDLLMLGVPADEHAGSEGLQRVEELVAGEYGEVDYSGEWRLLPIGGRTWATAMAQSLPAVEAFARRVLIAK